MFCAKCTDFWHTVFSKAEYPTTLSSCEDIQWKPYDTVLHTCMRELRASSDKNCILCRCIFASPSKYELATLLQDEDERVDITLSLYLNRSPYPILAAAFVTPEQNRLEGKLRLPKQTVAFCGDVLTDNEFASTLKRTMVMNNDSTGSEAALELASFWLNRCLETHEKCRIPVAPGGTAFIPTRVIDVGTNDDEIRLVETAKELHGPNTDRRFVALTHCWGAVQLITTRDENYEAHLERIDASELSKTFREAVHTTRTLGVRHLWIDSLCIIQSNAEDWEKEAATMCDVYHHALFTISAAHAPSGDVGCFEDRDGIIQFPFCVPVPGTRIKPSSSSSSAEISSEAPNNQRLLFNTYGRRKSIPSPEPPLYGRAWVLQEQVLSPRMLIFDGPHLKWECLCAHGSERTPLGGGSRHHNSEKAIKAGIISDVDFFAKNNGVRHEDIDYAWRDHRLSWCYVVMDYTHRGMTALGDRLVALDGIATALGRKTRDEYLAGLWKGHLWWGLLWSIAHSEEHTMVTTKGAFDVERFPHTRLEESIAPSWSWASVTVPIVYVVPVNAPFYRVCKVLDVRLTGTPAKKEGVMRMKGHVRTGFVNSIYPYPIREAVNRYPRMALGKPKGPRDLFTWRNRSFSPFDYFIFSSTKPSGKNNLESSDWRLVRGQWRPDEVLDPNTEITFIAIAQQNSGTNGITSRISHTDEDPLVTWCIGLVPTGRVKGEYRRVGYAVWEDCAWFGYICGPASRVETAKGLRRVFMKDIEYGMKPGKKAHEHFFMKGVMGEKRHYAKGVVVEEKEVTIV